MWYGKFGADWNLLKFIQNKVVVFEKTVLYFLFWCFLSLNHFHNMDDKQNKNHDKYKYTSEIMKNKFITKTTYTLNMNMIEWYNILCKFFLLISMLSDIVIIWKMTAVGVLKKNSRKNHNHRMQSLVKMTKIIWKLN